MTVKIIGAGLAGLLAANTAFQDSIILETQNEDSFKKHTALLRFRSPKIGIALGIDFKEITVHKNIYAGCKLYNHSDIFFANSYSKKVNGIIEDRSIWNLETTKRWIAPENFHDLLLERCKNRIQWGASPDFTEMLADKGDQLFINTAPLPSILNALNIGFDGNEFKSSSINVERYIIKDCNVYQTIYFPEVDFNCYRASISGNILTIESIGDITEYEFENITALFNIDQNEMVQLGSNCQILGKISPIDNEWRKNKLFELTHFYNVYSLGRFATWRQILLDDVLNDIYVIKKLMNTGFYEKSMAIAN